VGKKEKKFSWRKGLSELKKKKKKKKQNKKTQAKPKLGFS
jgi:hypothetical protein